jgi:hypothetical protein
LNWGEISTYYKFYVHPNRNRGSIKFLERKCYTSGPKSHPIAM